MTIWLRHQQRSTAGYAGLRHGSFAPVVGYETVGNITALQHPNMQFSAKPVKQEILSVRFPPGINSIAKKLPVFNFK